MEDASRPVGVEELATRLIHTLIGVRTKEVTLRLEQICRQARRAVAVVEGERR